MLDEEGFEIYGTNFDNRNNVFTVQKRLSQDNVFVENLFKFDDFLGIVFNKESAEVNYTIEHQTNTAMPDDGPNRVARGSYAKSNGPEPKMQESFLFNKSSRLFINEFGEPKNPGYLLKYGYWNWERVADLMPKNL